MELIELMEDDYIAKGQTDLGGKGVRGCCNILLLRVAPPCIYLLLRMYVFSLTLILTITMHRHTGTHFSLSRHSQGPKHRKSHPIER